MATKPAPAAPPPVTRLVSVAATADHFSITPKQVHRLIERGELLSVKLGRRRLIPDFATGDYIAGLIDQARAS